MERERLARLKRARGEVTDEVVSNASFDHTEAAAGVAADATRIITPPSKRQRISPPPPRPRGSGGSSQTQQLDSAAVNGKADGSTSAGLKVSRGKENESDLFWDGELRQVANRLVDRDKDVWPTFRLSEIIGPKSDITLAILSSYSNAVDWLYDFFEPTTPIVLVNQPGEDGNSGLKELAPNILMTKPFIRNGRGCMHIKILLLFYKDGRLRICLPTANFVEYDWRDIENTAWVQDVPMRKTTIRHDPKAADFPGTLQRVLHKLNVPAALTKLLDGNFPELPIEALSELRMRWDWSKVKVKLVASLAGKYEGWDEVERTGHPALAKAIQELGVTPPKGKELVLECQGSSIGTYSRQWMDEIYCSAKGQSAKAWLNKPRSQRMKLAWPLIKILFPSLATVKDSVLGMPGGGTMFCRKAQWESKNFPRELFHDSNSKRGRVLMHSKMIVGTFKDRVSPFVQGRSRGGRQVGKERDDLTVREGGDYNAEAQMRPSSMSDGDGGEERLAGWAYVGSHNFTPSAWGTVSGSVDKPSLNIVNYELGIVIPLRTGEEVENVACWRRPARKYVLDVDRPWMQEEMREGMAGI
ncbi:phospholipase D/nuclease [Fomitiporia mediterranea MF3/22]|uniref:phospholipase D/nuclease n=1 Tax=Fomitiporia mediterranea (strain MF3/22) TaxID=694068 RepID=UPI0004409C48|nr:phospholipase D/nuclease [Fomitiporia mediterranea MF3/22]EJD04669.1 phospholipase D/nuclease [Fomitiporia mediterranea MF3/22]